MEIAISVGFTLENRPGTRGGRLLCYGSAANQEENNAGKQQSVFYACIHAKTARGGHIKPGRTRTNRNNAIKRRFNCHTIKLQQGATKTPKWAK